MDYSERNKKVAQARWKKVIEKEKRNIPTDNKSLLLKSLLCGLLAGDGSVQIRNEKKSIHYQLDFFPDDKYMLDKYCEIIQKLYNKKPQIKNKQNFFSVRLGSKTIIEDLNEISNFGLKEWTLPEELWKIEGAKENWLSGFFSAEAYVGPNCIKLQTINEKGMNKISELLNELEIEHCSYQYTPKNLKHSKVYIIFINKKEAEFTQSHDREMLQEMFDEDGLVDSGL